MHWTVYAYLAINIALAMILHARRKTKALLWHLLAFLFISAALAIGLSEGTSYEPFARQVFFARLYEPFCNAVAGYGLFIFAPLMAAEWLIPFLALAAFGTAVALILLVRHGKDSVPTHPETAQKPTGNLSVYTSKRYRKHCVMRC